MGHELPSRVSLSENIDDITVVMPIGGKATRALSVTNDTIPKHLIKLANGQTVLDTITHGLQTAGFRKFVFCLGHHSDQLQQHLDGASWKTTPQTRHAFSVETTPLGPDGAIIQAIGALGITGQAQIIAGDLMLPWQAIRTMNLRHQQQGADITVGVTSHITPRTTDVGNIIGESNTGRLLACLPRTAAPAPSLIGAQNLTSAGTMTVSVERYMELMTDFLADEVETRPGQSLLSFRDQIMPWAIESRANFDMRVFDIEGEILDLGTPSNIRYGQENWRTYS